jgi:hypothetical protein
VERRVLSARNAPLLESEWLVHASLDNIVTVNNNLQSFLSTTTQDNQRSSTMVKKSAKSAPGSASRSSSKRAAPEKQTPSRQSKRAKVTAAKYSELNSDDSSEETQDVKASDFEADSSKEPTSESGDEEASEEASDDDVKPKKGNPRGRPTQRALPMHRKQADDKELWESGAKLPPGTQLIMKKPKARDAGPTPYTDDTIHPNTMLFLKDLAANNERQWLKCTYEYPCIRCLILYLPDVSGDDGFALLQAAISHI